MDGLKETFSAGHGQAKCDHEKEAEWLQVRGDELVTERNFLAKALRIAEHGSKARMFEPKHLKA